MDDVRAVASDEPSDFAALCWLVLALAADAAFWLFVLHLIGVL